MAISLMTPARTVLLVGDEALYVYKVTSGVAKLLETVPWAVEDFDEIVVGLIKKQGGGRPVLILNDMTDQHFKGGQRLPKVGLMDKAGVLKRKVQVAFPNYPIRGALPMKSKGRAAAPTTSKQSPGLYLFAAVPVSEPIVKTLDSVKQSMASIAGFALLPVESSDMVQALASKASGRGKKASRWVVFIGQHRNGALRQVITRDGQLAMTRMTPVVDSDADAKVWAQEVKQEFKATLSYLSRFGYSPDDGTDVIVIAGSDAGQELENIIDSPCNYYTFTAPEAARLLSMRIGRQEEMRYADPLHVAWAGRKSRLILPMEATDITKIQKPRQMVAAAVVLLLLSGAYMSWQLLSQMQAVVSTNQEIDNQRSVLARVSSEYQQEANRLDALGFDVELVQGAIKTYEVFEAETIDPLPLIQDIGEALGDELRLDNIKVGLINEAPARTGNFVAGEPKDASLEATMSLSFPPTIELDFGIREVNNLKSRLVSILPGYDVVITRQVARPEYTQNIKGKAGRTAEEIAAAEDYVAEIMIRGPKK